MRGSMVIKEKLIIKMEQTIPSRSEWRRSRDGQKLVSRSKQRKRKENF